MTLTVLALISIAFGILGAVLYGVIYSRHSLGLIGNTITGVFGSVFVVKSFGRMGFNPQAILGSGDTDTSLLLLNILISTLSGALAVYFGAFLKKKFK